MHVQHPGIAASSDFTFSDNFAFLGFKFFFFFLSLKGSLSPDFMHVQHLGTAVSSDFTQIESTSNAYFHPKRDWINKMLSSLMMSMDWTTSLQLSVHPAIYHSATFELKN